MEGEKGGKGREGEGEWGKDERRGEGICQTSVKMLPTRLSYG